MAWSTALVLSSLVGSFVLHKLYANGNSKVGDQLVELNKATRDLINTKLHRGIIQRLKVINAKNMDVLYSDQGVEKFRVALLIQGLEHEFIESL